MVYQLDLTGFVDLKIDPRYKVNVDTGVILGMNNKILVTKSEGSKYHCVSIGSNRVSLSRLIYSQVHGPIEGDYDVDHIDGNPNNNAISNLQLLTHQENTKKSAKNRDYSFVKNILKNNRRVKAINIDDNSFEIYSSMYSCQNDVGVNVGIIKMCCDNINHVKSGISKINNHSYRFEYTTEEPTKKIQRKNAKVKE